MKNQLLKRVTKINPAGFGKKGQLIIWVFKYKKKVTIKEILHSNFQSEKPAASIKEALLRIRNIVLYNQMESSPPFQKKHWAQHVDLCY